MSDAPGWAGVDDERGDGPICWKCKGTGLAPVKTGITMKKRKRTEVDVIACKVCLGTKRLKSRQKQTKNSTNPGIVRERKKPLPDGWVIPGPDARGGVDVENGEELCFLLGNWKIFQRIGGHRYSTDDIVTAWFAGQCIRESIPDKEPQRCLDLGCGIGSVLMMVAWQFQHAKCTGIEAQQLSFSMAKRSIQYNGCDDRCKVVNGDLRTVNLGAQQKFDLVTGTPPYFKVDFAADGSATPGMGGMPSCEQSAPARYEFRGGVESYCAAAAKYLDHGPHCRFIVCEGWLDSNTARVYQGALNSGLKVIRQVLVHGREDKPPLFAVYELAKASVYKETECNPGNDYVMKKVEGVDVWSKALVIRHKGGERTEEYKTVLRSMGIPC